MFAACGDDDGDAAPGDASEGGLIDSFLVETSLADTETTVANARLTLVNAAHDLGPRASGSADGNATVRLCFGTGSVAQTLEVPSLTPTPSVGMTGFPGVDQGRGLTLPEIAIPLAERVLTPIFITSLAIESAGEPTCDRLVGPTREMSFNLQENIDYWVLPAIAPFTFQPQHAYVLALTGCSGNATTGNPAKCGPGFVAGEGGAGNLALRVFEPDSKPGAQFLHLSPAANAFFFQTGERSNIEPNLGNRFVALAGVNPPLFALSPVVSAPLSDEQMVIFGKSQFLIGTSLASSFSEIATASGRDGAPYLTGGSYVFIAVGDPDMAETPPNAQGGPNSRYFHFLGFPSRL